jgi:predicted nucleic-acid-binding Zn-ribbon protein
VSDLPSKDQTRTPRVITDEEFSRFFIARKLKPDCIECGSNNWQILGQKPSEVPALLFINEQRSLIGNNVPFLVLACKVCGHPRFFARNAILEWLEKESDHS